MTMNPAFRQLVAFAKQHQGPPLPTLGRKSSFALEVSNEAFTYTPVTTQKPRRQEFAHANEVFNRYLETGSLKTSDYTDLTVNSSYLLALIKAFIAEAWPMTPNTKEGELHAIEGLLKERKILSRSRNRQLAARCKERDNYTCCACGFSTKIHDISVVECHHTVPLHESDGIVTDLNDLITLCPTCHRLVHLQTPPINVEDLRNILSRTSTFSSPRQDTRG